MNDHANVLDDESRARLEGFLDQVKRRTGAEFAILTVKTTAPLTPTEYKVKVFEKWGLGRRGEDDGLLMLVAMDEREVRFETGYGLEGALPDGLQSRIFRQEMQPRFREGDFPAGIRAGVLRSAYRIAVERGVTLEWDGREVRYASGRGDRTMPFWATLLLFVLAIIVIGSISRGGGGRGGGMRRGGGWHAGPRGWGGGFGGRSGGGSSFGGFSGGMSGGGGGGGSW